MKIKSLDFAALVNQVQAPMVGAETLALWGGTCTEAELLSLVQQWPNLAGLAYRLWEFSSEIKFEDKAAALPAEARWLERGRLFGPGGDLSFRRDGLQFLWHFIGQKEIKPPAEVKAEDFWQTADPTTRFHQNEETALLWGERKANFSMWFDDRTASATLKYPVNQTGRLQIKYHTFSRAGRVEFVWWLGLEAYHG